jgi:hypothetical protein
MERNRLDARRELLLRRRAVPSPAARVWILTPAVSLDRRFQKEWVQRKGEAMTSANGVENANERREGTPTYSAT